MFYSDPDRNFYPESFSCDYYIEDAFNESLVDDVTSLNYLYLLRCLASNFDRLPLLANVHFKVSYIGRSETWLQNSFRNCDISGYNSVHSLRLNNVGGGVGVVF